MFNLNGKKFKAGLAIAAFLGSTFSVLAEVEPLIMPAPLEPVPVEQIKAPVEQVKLKDTENKDGKPFVLPIPADLLKNKSKATDDPAPPPIAPPTSIIPGDKDNVLKNSIAIPVSEIKTVESGVASGSIESKEATSEYLESERNCKSYRLEGLFMTGEYLLVKPRLEDSTGFSY